MSEGPSVLVIALAFEGGFVCLVLALPGPGVHWKPLSVNNIRSLHGHLRLQESVRPRCSSGDVCGWMLFHPDKICIKTPHLVRALISCTTSPSVRTTVQQKYQQRQHTYALCTRVAEVDKPDG